MNNYETIFITGDDITEEAKKAVLDKIQNYLNSNAEITKTDSLGLRKFAYEIRKYTQGYYFIIEFKANPEIIRELERIYRITDEIIKFIVVRK